MVTTVKYVHVYLHTAIQYVRRTSTCTRTNVIYVRKVRVRTVLIRINRRIVLRVHSLLYLYEYRLFVRTVRYKRNSNCMVTTVSVW